MPTKKVRSLKKSADKKAPEVGVEKLPVIARPFFTSLPLFLVLFGAGFISALLIFSVAFKLSDSRLTIEDRVRQQIVIADPSHPAMWVVKDPSPISRLDPVACGSVRMGDAVLMWSDQTVVYSRMRHRVIAMFPTEQFYDQVTQGSADDAIDATSTRATASSTKETVESATVTILNGTRMPGLGRDLAKRLKIDGLTIQSVGDAVRKHYDHVTISQLSTRELPKTLQQLLILTGGNVEPFPAYEIRPKTDFVVIVGE